MSCNWIALLNNLIPSKLCTEKCLSNLCVCRTCTLNYTWGISSMTLGTKLICIEKIDKYNVYTTFVIKEIRPEKHKVYSTFLLTCIP